MTSVAKLADAPLNVKPIPVPNHWGAPAQRIGVSENSVPRQSCPPGGFSRVQLCASIYNIGLPTLGEYLTCILSEITAIFYSTVLDVTERGSMADGAAC